jgi:hypothetical protein
MDEEVRQLYRQRVSVGTSLAERGFGGNHHVPQDLWMKVGEGAFTHGKSEHIGGVIDAAIAGIQPVHPGIIDDEDPQVTALACEGREQPQQRLSERPSVDRDDLLLIPTTDGHSCYACAV